MRSRLSAITLAASLTPTLLRAQSRAADLVAAARVQISAGRYDSTDLLLRAALDSAAHPTFAEQATALVWRGVLEFLRGNDSLARVELRKALHLSPDLRFEALEATAPPLAAILEEERRAVGPATVYVSGNVEVRPQRVGGPSVHYPPAVARRRVAGVAVVAAVIDTFGHAEPVSIDIQVVPDSALTGPVLNMIAASTFTPGRVKGQAVRTLSQFQIVLHAPPPPNATALISASRAALAARHVDSAFALLRDALDPETRPTDGERMYGLLVRGIAWSRAGRDTLARADFDSAANLRRDLAARGVVLAPFLLSLADSVRVARRAGAQQRPATGDTMTAPPILASQPPIAYPPEMKALNVGGTVVLEATIDERGHVVAAQVVRSPNPGLNSEALRVVKGSVYRPARRGGRPVSAVVRQVGNFLESMIRGMTRSSIASSLEDQ